MREFEETDGPRLLGKYQQGNALFRMKGSGRRVKDIFPQMIANAEKLIGMAHKRKSWIRSCASSNWKASDHY
jgi:hypothetical protein